MTANKERSSSTPVLARTTVVLAALGLAACSTVGSPAAPANPGDGDGDGDGIDNPGDGDGDGDGDGNGGGDGDGNGGGGPNGCGSVNAAAKEVVTTYCADCHGAVPDNNNFRNILDAKALVDSGKIIPDDPDNSPLFKRVSTNTMPPDSYAKKGEFKQAQIDTLREWIECGAQDWDDEDNVAAEFISVAKRLQLIEDDLKNIQQEDRVDYRYFDLTNMSNAGYSQNELEEYRSSFYFVLNSVSTGESVLKPVAIKDSNDLIFRIKLQDYGWDAAKWDLLTAAYPYFVTYDEDDGFEFDQTPNDEIVEDTGDEIPYITVDWFLANAMIPPLYHDLLGIPGRGENISELFAVTDIFGGQGQELLSNILNQVGEDRAGYLDSQPSDTNRIQSHQELDGGRGYFWISYDFAENLGDQDIFVNPFNPDCDGGEAIFSLPNGLQGYYVIAGCPMEADANGQSVARELNIAPIDVVQDPLSFNAQVVTGLSCVTCHNSVGIIPKTDQVLDRVKDNFSGDERDLLEDLYPEADEMALIYDENSNRYRKAYAETGATNMNERTMHALHQRHLDEISIDDVSALLGLTTEQFKDALEGARNDLEEDARQFLPLLEERGQVDRDTLDDGFNELVEAIQLGVSVNPQ